MPLTGARFEMNRQSAAIERASGRAVIVDGNLFRRGALRAGLDRETRPCARKRADKQNR